MMDSSPQAAVAREASFPHLLLLVFAGAVAVMTKLCLWERNIVFHPRVPSPCSTFHGFLITHWVLCRGNEFQEKTKLRIQPCVLVFSICAADASTMRFSFDWCIFGLFSLVGRRGRRTCHTWLFSFLGHMLKINRLPPFSILSKNSILKLLCQSHLSGLVSRLLRAQHNLGRKI